MAYSRSRTPKNADSNSRQTNLISQHYRVREIRSMHFYQRDKNSVPKSAKNIKLIWLFHCSIIILSLSIKKKAPLERRARAVRRHEVFLCFGKNRPVFPLVAEFSNGWVSFPISAVNFPMGAEKNEIPAGGRYEILQNM